MNSAVAKAPRKERIEIAWGERRAEAELRRTSRRVLRIDVQPSGQVVVFAPSDGEIDLIRSRVRRKSPWIFRELDRIAGWPARTPARQFLSGETHLLLGKQYRLLVEQSENTEVFVAGSRLTMLVQRTDDICQCREALKTFYTNVARSVFRERLDLMAQPFMRKGIGKPGLVIRYMAKRWGSFTAAGRVVLNVDLVRASPLLIDYVICHELAHAFYPDHGKEWRELLSAVMPDWENRKARLEALLR